MIEVLKLALKALNAGEHAHLIMNTDGIKDKVRQAIAELESQEPLAWMKPDVLCDRACMYLCTKGFTQFPECANVPPQLEQNFCPRCGKRTNDIHTCTPPQENT
jgi:hypothetical protein